MKNDSFAYLLTFLYHTSLYLTCTISLFRRDVEKLTQITVIHVLILGFPSDSEVKKPPVKQETQETWVRSLAREDPLEEGMATHSNILAWRIPWTEEPGGLQSMGSQRVRHD